MTTAPREKQPMASLPAVDLEECHDFAASLAVRAGTLLCQSAYARAHYGYMSPSSSSSEQHNLDIRDKDSSVDVVTETDIRVEEFILREIRRRFPAHRILAEETYAAGGSKVFDLTDDPTWIVDPLDGTVNYVHLFPLICVSIGFAVDKQPVVGAVYAPLLGGFDPLASRGCLWTACRGRGAYQSHPDVTSSNASSSSSAPGPTLAALERHAPRAKSPVVTTSHAETFPGAGPRPLRLPLAPTRPFSRDDPPKGLLIASEWGKDRSDRPDSNLHRKAHSFLNLASEVKGREGKGIQAHGIRSLGSAALDLVYCASGAIDVFWEGGCWEWDVAAGLAILVEAGGFYTDANAPPPDAAVWTNTEAIPLPPASLGARRFLCIRPCAEQTRPGGGQEEAAETARQAQERIARCIWKALHLGGLNYSRQGVQYPQW